MEAFAEYHTTAAVFIARVFLGLLFFFQGFDAVFKVKIQNVILAYENALQNKGVPRFFIISGSWFNSCVELVAGLLLIFGLFQSIALFLLGMNLIIACIGFSLVKPMWDMGHVFPRLVLLLFLLMVPASWNAWSLDYFFN